MTECKKCYQAAASREYINKYDELIDQIKAANKEILAHRGNIIFINTPIYFLCDICGECNYYLEVDRPIELKSNV